jgi:hypothetical protein
MAQSRSRSFWSNAGLFALVLTVSLKLAPCLDGHSEPEPFGFAGFVRWIFNVDHFVFCFVFAYVAVVLNFRWLHGASATAVVVAAVLVAAQFSAMEFPFDGRMLEGIYRYFDVTDVDLIADVKLVLSLLSPFSAWLVFWMDARIRRTRSVAAA